MDTILFWGIIAILCAILQSLGIWKYGLASGFLITMTLLAIHYDFGTDYWAYYDWYEESLSMPFPRSISEFLTISHDPGWDMINLFFGKVFGTNGFFILVATLSIIESLCYYTFIKKFVPNNWYWFAMAIYILNNHFFILTFSMMRQSFVMAILLICFTWIQQRKIILPLFVILLASTIHNSVLLCCPVVFIVLFSFNNQKFWGILLLSLWLLLLTASAILEPILSSFANLTEMFAHYVDTYSKSSNMSYGIGYLLRLIPFIFLVIGLFTNQFAKEDVPMLVIWSLTIILTPFGIIIPLFERLLFYFELAIFAVFPKIIKTCHSIYVKILLTISVLILSIYTLYIGFYNPKSVYYDTFLDFHTIFEII